jgi:hypothetical protein
VNAVAFPAPSSFSSFEPSTDTTRDVEDDELPPPTLPSLRVGPLLSPSSFPPPSVEVVEQSGIRPAVVSLAPLGDEWLDPSLLEEIASEDDLPPPTWRSSV